jgi:hypothetical protein
VKDDLIAEFQRKPGSEAPVGKVVDGDFDLLAPDFRLARRMD